MATAEIQSFSSHLKRLTRSKWNKNKNKRRHSTDNQLRIKMIYDSVN